MRKLLLSTTALATAAALTAGAAVADVSITASTLFQYVTMGSTVALKDGSYNVTDSEVAVNFSNKTDSGLTIAYKVELETDEASTTNADENSFSISGGFGKVSFGQMDGAADDFAIAAQDAIAEEVALTFTSSSINQSSEMQGGTDATKIAYHTPSISGFTAGVSYTDSGTAAAANTSTDTTEWGAKYSLDAAGAVVTLGVGSSKQENATKDLTTDAIGVSVVSGNITGILSSSTYKADDENIQNRGIGLKYDMGNGLVLGGYNFKSEDSADEGEELTRKGVEAQYTIAPGLTAMLTVEDYVYNVVAATHEEGAPVADKGQATTFTIKATF